MNPCLEDNRAQKIRRNLQARSSKFFQEFSRRDQVADEKKMQVFTLINKTCKFGGTRKSQVSFHLVKPILAAIRCYSKLLVFSSRSSTLGAHFQINNECKVVFPHFFVVRPKTFEILKRSGKIKTNTVYQYCQKFNMRKESTWHFILLSLIKRS